MCLGGFLKKYLPRLIIVNGINKSTRSINTQNPIRYPSQTLIPTPADNVPAWLNFLL